MDEVLKLISRQIDAAEIKRRRETDVYRDISQFRRLDGDYDYDPHDFVLTMASSSSSPRAKPMWKPSFTFRFAAWSAVRRLWRRIGSFFKPSGQRLPYFHSAPSSVTSSSFLSRNDTNMFGHRDRRWMSSARAYWNRLWTKSKRGLE